MRVFILVQGSNLIRPDLDLEYRLSPGSIAASGRASLVPPDELEEWAVSYLVEPKVSRWFVVSYSQYMRCETE